MNLLKISLVTVFSLMPAICAAGFDMSSVKDYGAVGDGVADDSAAFNRCLSANQTCWVNTGLTFKIGNVKMKQGQRLQGMGVMDYAANTAATTPVRPLLVGNGSEFMIDMTATSTDGSSYGPGVAIVGLFMDCRDTDKTNGISFGAGATVQEVTIVNCLVGLGGGDNRGHYTTAYINHSSFGFNGTGARNLVDSFITNSSFANNLGDGLLLAGSSNANSITNTRFEWNNGFGLSVYLNSEGNSVSNCFFDRNGKAGVAIIQDLGITLANNTFFGNGRLRRAPDANTQIYIDSSRNTSITGGVSKLQRSKYDNTSAPVPQYVLSFNTNRAPNSNISIVGMMTSGRYDKSKDLHLFGFTDGVIEGAEKQPATSYVLQGLVDTPDVRR